LNSASSLASGAGLPLPQTGLQTEDSQAIDGLRGLAALIVVASHASNMGLHWLPGVSFSGSGKYGVYLFFVISAFLLTHQWLQAPPAQQRSGRFLGAYLGRRVLRIYPLYALVLLAGWLLPPPGLGVPMDGAALARHLALWEGRDLYWSVPVEFMYYLVIPPLALWLATALAPRWRLLGVLVLLAAALAVWPSAQAPLNSIALGYYLPLFLAGSMVAWRVSRQSPGKGVASGPASGPAGGVATGVAGGVTGGVTGAVSWLDAAALLLLALSVPSVFQGLGWSQDIAALHRSFVGWGVFWGLLLLALLAGRLPLWHRLLGWSGMRACGRWCFGLYLLHMPALYLCKVLPLPSWSKGGLALLVAVAVAAAAHRIVERPAMALGRRLFRSR